VIVKPNDGEPQLSRQPSQGNLCKSGHLGKLPLLQSMTRPMGRCSWILIVDENFRRCQWTGDEHVWLMLIVNCKVQVCVTLPMWFINLLPIRIHIDQWSRTRRTSNQEASKHMGSHTINSVHLTAVFLHCEHTPNANYAKKLWIWVLPTDVR